MTSDRPCRTYGIGRTVVTFGLLNVTGRSLTFSVCLVERFATSSRLQSVAGNFRSLALLAVLSQRLRRPSARLLSSRPKKRSSDRWLCTRHDHLLQIFHNWGYAQSFLDMFVFDMIKLSMECLFMSSY